MNLAQNDIIKLFSVIAVIFMLPTVIASIYGMNFKEMPELARIIHDSTSFSSPRGARAPSTSPDLIRIGV